MAPKPSVCEAKSATCAKSRSCRFCGARRDRPRKPRSQALTPGSWRLRMPARTPNGSCASTRRRSSSVSTASWKCEQKNSSNFHSSCSIPRSFCWLPARATTATRSTGHSSCCPTFPPASSPSQMSRCPAVSRSRSSNGRESTRSSSERDTSPISPGTFRRRSKPGAAGDHRSGTRWVGPGVTLAVILAGAAALRLVGIQYGLPFGNLLNPDEQSIVPRAWKLVHGGGGDPHWFDYPSLLMYVNAPFQLWHDEPSYLTARIVGVALALGAIAASWWLGRRAYGTASAGVVAASVVAVEVAYSRAAVTDVPLTLAVGVALALMVSGRIELAGLAVGIATGFKYPGVFLLVPLVVAA